MKGATFSFFSVYINKRLSNCQLVLAVSATVQLERVCAAERDATAFNTQTNTQTCLRLVPFFLDSRLFSFNI